uniref:serine beta-lactamase-like protein LACTB, mitochondrial n=1 Tax=Ciona intestinalis TaxID=7719 RepID=UPI000EF53F52|nr:serine beta-lactamase-like protein LACTB, mitochondrial [Ciona intestinalis]|eukprot:XP_026696540.1 serine beta-lactamase-like protein LACTB, mitochondrial [Ciona intestinalis]
MKDMFDSLDMRQTQMETNDRIVYGRSGCYDRKNGKLYNSRNIDFSFRGAGAGFLSTVGDLIKFGNAMLYSYQASDTNLPRGFLKRDTVRTLWTNCCRPRRTDRSSEPRNYNCGMGWFVYTEKEDLGTCPKVNFSVGHFGFVYGASGIILLVPDPGTSQQKPCEVDEPVTNGFDTPEQSTVGPPSGLCVAIQANISEVNFGRLARDISREFLKCNSQQFSKTELTK